MTHNVGREGSSLSNQLRCFSVPNIHRIGVQSLVRCMYGGEARTNPYQPSPFLPSHPRPPCPRRKICPGQRKVAAQVPSLFPLLFSLPCEPFSSLPLLLPAPPRARAQIAFQCIPLIPPLLGFVPPPNPNFFSPPLPDRQREKKERTPLVRSRVGWGGWGGPARVARHQVQQLLE